ncbi:MAG TPA: hypothetical protein VHE35_15355, partial [Kofleriaceae bacterium]|nr:hypothetical protein [Kofleriaceae bacterium]
APPTHREAEAELPGAATAQAAPEAEPTTAMPHHQIDPVIDDQRRKLHKRGFRRDDIYYHQCKDCGEHAVESYTLVGKPGGRDIMICLACGHSWSWRRRPDKEDREVDATFDLVAFLR